MCPGRSSARRLPMLAVAVGVSLLTAIVPGASASAVPPF
jgi:hypothetical protein